MMQDELKDSLDRMFEAECNLVVSDHAFAVFSVTQVLPHSSRVPVCSATDLDWRRGPTPS